MKEMAVIKAEKRTEMNSRINKRLRRSGYSPGSIFGRELEPLSIAVNRAELEKLVKSCGRNAVFKIEIDGADAHTVIVKEIHNGPITNEVLNVGFQQISLSEEIKTSVTIKIIGTEAVEAKRMIAQQQMDSITVKGLPQDIPDSIEVDVSKLKAGENITVGDIEFQQGITTENDPDQLVVSVNESKRQEPEDDGAEESAAEKAEA